MSNQPFHSKQFTRQFRDMVAKGDVAGWSRVRKFGHNTDVDGPIEDIWANGGIYSYLTAAANMEVISDSANDTAAGSGARTIEIQGLDSNWKEISEVVVLNGVTAVLTVNDYLRLNRAFVVEGGTSHIGSAGEIQVQVAGGGAIQLSIERVDVDTFVWDYGQSQVARYTVPANKTAYIDKVVFSGESNKRTDVGMFAVRNNLDPSSAPFAPRRVILTSEGVNRAVLYNLETPIVLPERTDIIIQARSSSGTNGRVTAVYELLLEDMD